MAKSSTGGSAMRKERYRNCCYCQSEPKRVREAELRRRNESSLNLHHNHSSFHFCLFVFRWSRSVLTRFGLNSEFWPDLPQPTNTHSSKVNRLHCFITADHNQTHFVLTLFVIDFAKAANNWSDSDKECFTYTRSLSSFSMLYSMYVNCCMCCFVYVCMCV